MGFQGRDSGQDALGPGSANAACVPTPVGSPGTRGRDAGDCPGTAEGLTWSRVLSSSSSLSSSRLRLMRSRRRFSTSGFSICDQQERESGPTGPRLSAAARAFGSRFWESPARIPSRTPQREPRAGPFGSLSAPPPKAPRVNVCKLASSLSRVFCILLSQSCPPSSPLCVSPFPLFSLRLRLVQSLSRWRTLGALFAPRHVARKVPGSELAALSVEREISSAPAPSFLPLTRLCSHLSPLVLKSSTGLTPLEPMPSRPSL